MNAHTTPLERLIDALQSALLSAQAVEQAGHDLTDESRHLLNAVQQMGRCVHELHPTAGEGGVQ